MWNAECGPTFSIPNFAFLIQYYLCENIYYYDSHSL